MFRGSELNSGRVLKERKFSPQPFKGTAAVESKAQRQLFGGFEGKENEEPRIELINEIDSEEFRDYKAMCS